MKLKKGFILREAGTDTVVVADGETLDLNGMITLNETAKLLWCMLEKGATSEELVKGLCAEYDVDEETAARSVQRFVEKLKGLDFLE